MDLYSLIESCVYLDGVCPFAQEHISHAGIEFLITLLSLTIRVNFYFFRCRVPKQQVCFEIFSAVFSISGDTLSQLPRALNKFMYACPVWITEIACSYIDCSAFRAAAIRTVSA